MLRSGRRCTRTSHQTLVKFGISLAPADRSLANLEKHFVGKTCKAGETSGKLAEHSLPRIGPHFREPSVFRPNVLSTFGTKPFGETTCLPTLMHVVENMPLFCEFDPENAKQSIRSARPLLQAFKSGCHSAHAQKHFFSAHRSQSQRTNRARNMPTQNAIKMVKTQNTKPFQIMKHC